MFLQTLKQYIDSVTMFVQLLFYIKLKPVLSLDGVFIWACSTSTPILFDYSGSAVQYIFYSLLSIKECRPSLMQQQYSKFFLIPTI
jgi:hypothetical protein